MRSLAAHVYQIYIAATPEQVWTAITDSEWTSRSFHSTAYVEPPEPGRPYRTVVADGRPAVDGLVEEMQPPSIGRPGRFVQTWHTLYDPDLAHEPASRVEWTVEQAGEGLTPSGSSTATSSGVRSPGRTSRTVGSGS
jgi:uncharacterized protein YndB with AHSA1/START domain